MREKLTVVYVEDRPSVANLLRTGLRLFNIEVGTHYPSAETLLDNLDTDDCRTADVFIFDIRLPRMTGLELAGRLRELGDTRPLVLVSEMESPQPEILHTVDAVFLSKPFNFPSLVNTLRDLVRQPSE